MFDFFYLLWQYVFESRKDSVGAVTFELWCAYVMIVAQTADAKYYFLSDVGCCLSFPLSLAGTMTEMVMTRLASSRSKYRR